jgi:hypothetical protein
MRASNRALWFVATFALAGGAVCSSRKGPDDGGIDASGNGGQIAGTAGGAGRAGGAGGAGGQPDAGACRMMGDSCEPPQFCCAPLVCAGSCTMIVGQSLPEACRGLDGITLSAPTIHSGVASPGGSVVVGLTMTSSDPNAFVSYVGAVNTPLTSGVSVRFPEVSPPGASIGGLTNEPVEFTATLDASVSPGTQASFTARVFGWGNPAPDCANAFVLSFSLPVQ